ncbi:MAG: leucine-rich repeat domain-containing protein [Dehalococcoidales bacterium]
MRKQVKFLPLMLLLILFTPAIVFVGCQRLAPNIPTDTPESSTAAEENIIITKQNDSEHGQSQLNPSELVSFPDKNLDSIIRRELNKEPEEPITVGELTGITGLTIGMPFSSSGLAESFYLSDPNSIKQINNLSGLEYCVNLCYLRILVEDNRVNDLSPLASLTRLTHLEIQGNNSSYVTMAWKNSDMPSINHAKGQSLNVSPLANLTDLTYLFLDGNQITDISFLSSLNKLTELSLNNNQINNISAIARLTNLRRLQLSYNQVSDLSPLKDLTELRFLRLNNNLISDTVFLAGLSNIDELYLSNNHISDLTPLVQLTKLDFLDLNGNQISDLSPLAKSSRFTSLWLNDNKITNISSLKNLVNLRYLRLGGNQINDISALSRLTNLTYLGLYHNQIMDVTPLVANDGLGTGDRIILAGNPLSDDSRNKYIPLLRQRGADIDLTEVIPVPATE